MMIVLVSGWRLSLSLTELMEAHDVARHYTAVVARLESVVGGITDAESEQRGYMLTGAATYLGRYDDAKSSLDSDFDAVLSLTPRDDRLHAHILLVQDLTRKRLEQLDEGIRLHRAGHTDSAIDVMNRGRPLAREIRASFARLVPEYELARADARRTVEEMKINARRSFGVTFSLIGLVLIGMGMIVIMEARLIRSLSHRLLYASRHDELTGLPNRAYTQEWLSQHLSSAKRVGEKVGLLYLDLNGFKQINDVLGHATGDEVLVKLAGELMAVRRESDFVGRLGGDEFVVVMPRITGREQGEAAAARFSAISVEKESYAVRAAVGFALYPDDEATAEGLIKAADAAMYASKRTSARISFP